MPERPWVRAVHRVGVRTVGGELTRWYAILALSLEARHADAQRAPHQRLRVAGVHDTQLSQVSAVCTPVHHAPHRARDGCLYLVAAGHAPPSTATTTTNLSAWVSLDRTCSLDGAYPFLLDILEV